MDKATEYTLQLFDALEKTLHIRWNDAGEPFAFPTDVNTISIQHLTSYLHDLYDKRTVLDAISGFEGYQGYQSAAVGYAEDFDAFLKVGMLVSERIVLWEANLLSQINIAHYKPMGLLHVVCSILRMRKLVEAGGAVYLPHPRHWNPRYSRTLNEFTDTKITNELLGLANATILWKDFKVGSFSWHRDFNTLQKLSDTFKTESTGSDEHEITFALQSLIQHNELPYLKDVGLSEFFEATRDEFFRKGLRKKLRVFKDRFEKLDTMEEREKEINDLIEALISGMNEQKKQVKNLLIKHIVPSTLIANAGLGILNNLQAVAINGSSLLALFMLLGGSLAGGSNLHRLFKALIPEKSDDVMIYNVFAKLDEVSHEKRIKDYLDSVNHL